jgi:hypothetical protein
MLTQWQKRRLVEYHIQSRFTRLTTPEGYDFAFVPKDTDPDSAMWSYEELRKRHNLVINETLDEIIEQPRAKGHLASIKNFCQAVYDHEGAHSLFTERDNKLLGELQKKADIPFHLWNMTEDARIEAEWRRKFGRRFHWPRYMLPSDDKPPTDPLEIMGGPKNAINLFLDCKNMENSPKMIREWLARDKDPKIQFEGKGRKYGRRQLVLYYYRRAIRRKTTRELIPLIQSWIRTFPETKGAGGGGMSGAGASGEAQYKGPGAGDMPKAGEGPMPEGAMPKHAQDADGKPHKQNERTTKPMPSGTGAGESPGSDVGTTPIAEKDEDYHYKGKSQKLQVPKNRYFSPRKVRSFDVRRADGLVRLFEKFLEGGEGMVTSRNPSNKIDFNKFMRGADDFYVRKGDDPLGVKKITFIMDCSGSMARAANDGVYLAYVLNRLVQNRKIECRSMILSGGDNHVVQMPFDNRLLEHIQTPGGHEGFARTMRQHEKQLVDSDMTIFFTDGNITDEHIVKEDWHRKGVYTIGLFVGDPSRSASLHRWFDSVLVRDSIEAVADSLIQLIKRQ